MNTILHAGDRGFEFTYLFATVTNTDVTLNKRNTKGFVTSTCIIYTWTSRHGWAIRCLRIINRMWFPTNKALWVMFQGSWRWVRNNHSRSSGRGSDRDRKRGIDWLIVVWSHWGFRWTEFCKFNSLFSRYARLSAKGSLASFVPCTSSSSLVTFGNFLTFS